MLFVFDPGNSRQFSRTGTFLREEITKNDKFLRNLKNFPRISEINLTVTTLIKSLSEVTQFDSSNKMV